jgi:metallo-beta-lactamase class B
MKLAALLAGWCLATAVHAAPALDAPLKCSHCHEWNQPQTAFRLHGNTFYVGTKRLSAVLIAGNDGLVLLDGGLPQSAPLIRRNIESLGYRMRDVKLIVDSHAHFDHAGGIAALRAWSGATVAASPSGAAVLRAGTVGRDDPQYEIPPFRVPPVHDVQEVQDGETLRVGDIALTAHFTPGHTPGSTTWTWRSCDRSSCIDVVYADSLNAVSIGGYQFTPVAATFRASIENVAKLPCDLVVSVHPDFTGIIDKHERATTAANAFIDPAGCRNYAGKAMRALEKRLSAEKN